MKHITELLARDRGDLSLTECREIDAHVATCARCSALQVELTETDRLLKGREPYVSIPRFDHALHPRERATPFLLATAGVLALLAVLVLAPILATRGERAARPAPAATTAPSATPLALSTSTPPTPAPTAAGLFENVAMGFRITLPTNYHLSILPGAGNGRTVYTTVPGPEETTQCASDRGDVGATTDAAYLYVEVYPNGNGVSALEWAKTTRLRSPGATVEGVPPIDGHEAARAIEFGKTSWYAINANGRIYWIGPHVYPSRHPLDTIVTSFRAITPQSVTTPSPAPRQAATDTSNALAAAFAAKDADGVAKLIWPRCWLNVYSTVPSDGAGRSIAKFVPALRQQLASGAVSVTVDPGVQSEPTGAGDDRLFVRSIWNESGKVTQVDLILANVDGHWYWSDARHHHEGGASFSCLWVGTLYPNCP
jgi:hypothetical protein